MKPSIEQLNNNTEYELVESFKIDEMNQFLQKEMNGGVAPDPSPKSKKNAIIKAMLIGGVFGVIGYFVGKFFAQQFLTSQYGDFAQVGWAFLAFFVVILPIHELIHGIAFKYLGAPKISFGYSWKSLMVYCYAQKFVMNLRENSFVAAQPFIWITSALVLALFVLPQYTVLIAVLLFVHTVGCIGDFLLIKYARRNKGREIYLYDDVDEASMSYFFEKKS
jgi:hypothetical protein